MASLSALSSSLSPVAAKSATPVKVDGPKGDAPKAQTGQVMGFGLAPLVSASSSSSSSSSTGSSVSNSSSSSFSGSSSSAHGSSAAVAVAASSSLPIVLVHTPVSFAAVKAVLDQAAARGPFKIDDPKNVASKDDIKAVEAHAKDAKFRVQVSADFKSAAVVSADGKQTSDITKELKGIDLAQLAALSTASSTPSAEAALLGSADQLVHAVAEGVK